MDTDILLPPLLLQNLHMFSSPNKIHGCTLDIQDIHSRIIFPTASDALVASLIVKYANVTLELFDDLLALCRHPEFDTANISMTRVEEFMSYISDQRRSIGKERVTVRVKHVGGVPQLILEFVVDQIDSERIPFHARIRSERAICGAEDTLRNMSLVHRSWTYSAQRCLRRRIRARGYDELRSILQSPRLGIWVRELDIGRHHSSFVPGLFGNFSERSNPRDVQRLNCEILKRCPNVKELCIEDFYTTNPGAGSSQPIPLDIFQHLRELQNLEKLWLHQNHERKGATDIRKLCTILPHLRSLKSLKLQRWFSPIPNNEEVDVQYLSQVSAANTSLNLSYLALIYVSDPVLLSWLGRSCHECPPKGLELSLRDILRSPGHLKRLANPLPFLDLVTPFVANLVLHDYEPGDDIQSIFHQFPSLNSLCLFLYSYAILPEGSFVLPSSIRIVRFHYTCPPGDDQERYILFTLRASPQIRKLVVTYSRNSLAEEDVFNANIEAYKATSDYCKENKVEFIFERTDVWPSILDI